VKAGEGGSGGWNGAEEKGKEGTQQGREGRKQEGEARGEGEVIEGTDSGCTLQPLWMGRTHAA